MGLIILPGLLASAIGAVAGVSVYHICKWLGRRDIGERWGTLTGVVWAATWFGPLVAGTVWLTTDLQLGLNGAQADAALTWLDVPPGKASDVSYKRTYQRSYAEFKMSEADFLAWMKSQGRQPKRFTFKEPWAGSVEWKLADWSYHEDGMVTPVRDLETDKEKFVLNGYSFADQPCARAECFWTIIYDVDDERVYVMR
jgi:hypothetical protein